LGDVTTGVNDTWVLFNLPASTRSLPENIPSSGQLADGTRQATNSQGTVGYFPPCIIGQASRVYRFTLYALDVTLTLAPGADYSAVLAAASGHMLAQGQLQGTYNGSPIATPRT
jgi:phosphatidylethanolamine-binding protein (PEBP) family uncharacterized protein